MEDELFSKPTHVHQYTGHTGAISSILLIRDGSLFMTASVDQTVRLWSVSSFALLYTFDIGYSPARIWMTRTRQFVLQADSGRLKVGELTAGFKLHFRTEQDIVKMTPIFASKTAQQDNCPFGFCSLGSDNSVSVISVEGHAEKLISTVYPPPKATDIQNVMYFVNDKRMLLLTNDGTIFIYSITKETAVLLDSLKGKDIVDDNGFGVKGVFSCVEKVTTKPPVFDKFKSIMQEQKHPSQVIDPSDDVDYLAIGSHQGTLIIVSEKNFRRVVYRNQVAKARITMIKEAPAIGALICLSDDLRLALI